MPPPRRSPLWIRSLALGVGGVLASVFAFIMFSALEALARGRGLSLFGNLWSPGAGQFGIMPMIAASLLLSLSALALGWTVSLGCCCALHLRTCPRLSKLLMGILRFMTAMPTVVYGFAAVFLLVPLIRSALGGSGFCWFTAGVVLALQGVPTMTLVMDGAMASLEKETGITSAALGFTPLQHLVWVVLPSMKPWLFSAAVLGFGRAMGDTLIPTMLAGNAPQFPASPLDSVRTLTAHISLVLSSDMGGGEHLSLMLSGGILLTISLLVSLTVRYISFRGRRR